jgi:hypothetical protein
VAVGNTMSPKIEFETADGTDSIKRKKWRVDGDGFVECWNPDTDPQKRVVLPRERIIRINYRQWSK